MFPLAWLQDGFTHLKHPKVLLLTMASFLCTWFCGFVPRTGLHLDSSAHLARLSWLWLGMSLVSDPRMLNSNGNFAGPARFGTTQALPPIKIGLSPWKPLWGVEKLATPFRAQATAWHHSSRLVKVSQEVETLLMFLIFWNCYKGPLKICETPASEMALLERYLPPKDWQPAFVAETHGMWSEKTHSPKLSSDSVAHTTKHMSSQHSHNATTIIITNHYFF